MSLWWCLSHEPDVPFMPGFLKVLEIPRGARHLLIQELKATLHTLGMWHSTRFSLMCSYAYTLILLCYVSGINVSFSHICSCQECGIRTVLFERGIWIPRIPLCHRKGHRVGIWERQWQGDPSNYWSPQTWNSYHGKYVLMCVDVLYDVGETHILVKHTSLCL